MAGESLGSERRDAFFKFDQATLWIALGGGESGAIFGDEEEDICLPVELFKAGRELAGHGGSVLRLSGFSKGGIFHDVLVASEELAGTERERILENGVGGAELVAGVPFELLNAAAMNDEKHYRREQDEKDENGDEDFRGKAQLNLWERRHRLILWKPLHTDSTREAGRICA